MKIGFIGLGLMGAPMAKNILNKGFDLTIYNRHPQKTKQLKKLGARVANSPQELALASDVVITMVTGPEDVQEVLFSDQGVIAGKPSGLVVIDMSTIGPTAARKIAGKLKLAGIEFIDAPVTGSTPKAILGELTIFIGGDPVVYEKVKPVLAAMGTNLCFIGPVGSGQAIKLINNLLVASTITAVAEGMLLADAQGLPRTKVQQFLSEVPATSAFMKLKMPSLVKEDYPVLFSMKNMAKDLKLALTELSGKSLPELKIVEQLFTKGIELGHGEEDISAVLESVKNSA